MKEILKQLGFIVIMAILFFGYIKMMVQSAPTNTEKLIASLVFIPTVLVSIIWVIKNK